MNILIIFEDKHRLVENSVRTLAEHLRRNEHQVDSYDIEAATPNILQKYNAVVIAGAVIFGKFDNDLKQYLEQNQQELMIKPLYFLLHSPTVGEEFKKQVATQLPAEPLQHGQTFNLGFDWSTLRLSWWQRLRKKLSGSSGSNYKFDRITEIAAIIEEHRVGNLFD